MAKLFTHSVYQFDLKGSGSPIAEPAADCRPTSKCDSRLELQLLGRTPIPGQIYTKHRHPTSLDPLRPLANVGFTATEIRGNGNTPVTNLSGLSLLLEQRDRHGCHCGHPRPQSRFRNRFE